MLGACRKNFRLTLFSCRRQNFRVPDGLHCFEYKHILINMNMLIQNASMPAIVRLASVLVLALPGMAGADSLAHVVVAPHAVAVGFPADAVVEALQQATVASQVSGRIVDVKVDAGQRVRKGELLMRIDAREVAEAAQAARSQLATAQAHYERTKSLRAQNFISQAGLDKARTDYDAARAAASQAGVGLDHASVTAPIAGIVAQRHAEQGEMAAPGRPLATIFDPAGLRVTASIPQYKLRDMRGVKTARIEFPELGRTLESTAVMVLPTADAATHVSQVRVELPKGLSAESEGLVPGMFARVRFITGSAMKMTVPTRALVRRGEMTAVYVDGDHGLTLRQLRVGEAVSDSETEVMAGLSAGERVVVDPVKAAIQLKSGR